uniref:C50 family peptidase n=1 Tax=Bacillus thuringiensis TaxID=1428 RepID=UPI0021E8290F
IHTNASHCLNFMIYIQNMYLNQKEKKGNLRFPYIAKTLHFSSDFETNFKELWHSLRKQIANDRYDLQIFYVENNTFYEKLFDTQLCNEESFKEILCSFKVWWTSIVGQHSLEWSVSEYSTQLYNDLVLYLKQNQIEPLQQLHIILLYDDCVFAKENISSYFAILLTKTFFIGYRDVVATLSKCFKQ